MSRQEVAEKADELFDMFTRVGVGYLAGFTYEDLIRKLYEIIEASGWDSPLETEAGRYLAAVDDELCFKFNSLKYYKSEEQLREECEGFDNLERLVEVWRKYNGN